MDVEVWEQVAVIVVKIGLVARNFFSVRFLAERS